MSVLGVVDLGDVVRTIITALSGAGVFYAANRTFKSDHDKNVDDHTIALIDSGLEVHASALKIYERLLVDCNKEIGYLKGRLDEVSRQCEKETKELRAEILLLKAAQ